jgi:excisionase family DNA binding protein
LSTTGRDDIFALVQNKEMRDMKRVRKAPPKRRPAAAPENWREMTTLSIEQARMLLGLGRNAAYVAAARKELPAVRFGNSWRVPVPQLKRMIDGEAA